MSAERLDGRALAEAVRGEVKEKAAAFRAKTGRGPGLDVVLVGDDPASHVYTRGKEKAAREADFVSARHVLPGSASEAELLALIKRLNEDKGVDGILVQLPLPKGIDPSRVTDAIDPRKDVDGFHPENAGLLATGRPRFVPCTPLGCLELVRASGVDLRGAHAVVVGRSHIVGRPMAELLVSKDATVTIAHSKSRDLQALCRTADVLVAAVGRAELVRGDWIKPGAVVIDVGINRVDAPELGAGKTRLVGDVAFAEASEVARAITPVPGGVGPLTIAMLLRNTLAAAFWREGISLV